MKRDLLPASSHEELPHLPDDVVVEILFYAFPAVGECNLDTKRACRARLTSPRIKSLIDRYLFGPVRKLSHDVLCILDDRNAPLFHGLKKLKLFETCPLLSERTLKSMTGLESLTLFSSDHAGDEIVQALTNLRKLVLYSYESISCLQADKKHVTLKSLRMLTRLETLVVMGRRTIHDESIAPLHQLRHLHVGYVPIEGYCFASLTRLERLYLNNTNVKEENLGSLVHLKRLGLGCNKFLTDNSLSTLTGLVNLTLENGEISGDALLPFRDTLEVIKLDYRSIVEWHSLKECRNLKEVHLDGFEQMRADETREFLEKERGIKFIPIFPGVCSYIH